jgi:pyruvate,water dikinase
MEEKLRLLREAAARWQNQILPRVIELTDYYLGADFDSMSNELLVEELSKIREVKIEAGRLHHLATQPWQIMINMLMDTYSEVTGGSDLEAVRLLQGSGNKSVEAGHAMWKLSMLARSIPSLSDEISKINRESVLQTLERIRNDQAAQPFLEALNAFLDEFGWRNDLLGFDEPTWREDPTIALVQLRSHVLADESYNPNEELARLAKERDEVIKSTKNRVGAADWSRIKELLDIATPYASILEDHNHYIDQRLTTAPRRLFIAIGRRLVEANLIDRPDEVFFLFFDEAVSALDGKTSDSRTLVAERAAEMDYWSMRIPPRQVGKQGARGLGAQVLRSFGEHSLESDQPHKLVGNAGATGSATGVARVLLNLSEAERLNKGDVLVARTTMPPWTPLFAVASAIVVETGGVLSHAAITAREYGIPAVMGVRDATRTIRDGQLVEVDGDNGQVTIIN